MSDEFSLLAECAGDLVNGLQNIPQPVQRNFFKAAGALIAGLVDVPTSYLEMKSAEFKVKKQGHQIVMNAAAQNAAKFARKSPEITARALNYFAADINKWVGFSLIGKLCYGHIAGPDGPPRSLGPSVGRGRSCSG